MYSKIAVAAVLAAAPVVRATGQAVVENHCDFPVYLWSVSNSDGEMQTVDANDGNWSETYRTNSNGGGVSIKIARDQSQSSITQFEYTLDSTLWYDISNINGYPFEDWGVSLEPTESSCRSIQCPAGVAACSDAYNVPSDNHATSACSTEATTKLVLCSNQQGGSTDTSSAAPSSAPSAAPSSSGSIVTTDANGDVAVAAAPVASPVAQTTPPPAAPAPVDNSGSGDNVFTTFATEWVTVEPPAASEAPADNSGPQWFGHHDASWNGKARRHVHHVRGGAHVARD